MKKKLKIKLKNNLNKSKEHKKNEKYVSSQIDNDESNKQKKSFYNKNKVINIILPTPFLEPLVQTYRFKYNFFSQFGIPSHLTLIYGFKLEKYIKDKDSINNIINIIVKVLKNKKMTIENVGENINLIYLKLSEKDTIFLNTIQQLFSKLTGIKSSLYYNPETKPHITICTKNRRNISQENIDNVKKDLEKNLPINFKFPKLWVIEVNKKTNEVKILQEIIINS